MNYTRRFKAVISGETYYGEDIKDTIQNRNYDNIDYNQLTEREAEVLKFIVDGMNSTEIGGKVTYQ